MQQVSLGLNDQTPWRKQTKFLAVLNSVMTGHFHQDPVHQTIRGDPCSSFHLGTAGSTLLIGHLLNESKSQQALRPYQRHSQGWPRKVVPGWRPYSHLHREPSLNVCMLAPAYEKDPHLLNVLSLGFTKKKDISKKKKKKILGGLILKHKKIKFSR